MDEQKQVVLWLWDAGHPCCGVGILGHFAPVEAKSRQIDTVLVAAGLTDSRSEAQRLIKGGGVSWRKSDGGEWSKVHDFKEIIASGWPWNVRIGNGNWRLVPRKDGRTGWNQFPGVVTVMVPEDNQTIDCWSEVWRIGDATADPAKLAEAEYDFEMRR